MDDFILFSFFLRYPLCSFKFICDFNSFKLSLLTVLILTELYIEQFFIFELTCNIWSIPILIALDLLDSVELV